MGWCWAACCPLRCSTLRCARGVSRRRWSSSWPGRRPCLSGTTVGRAAPTCSAPRRLCSPASRQSAGLISQNETLYLAWAVGREHGLRHGFSRLRRCSGGRCWRCTPSACTRSRRDVRSVARLPPRVRHHLGGMAVRPHAAGGRSVCGCCSSCSCRSSCTWWRIPSRAGRSTWRCSRFTAWYPLRELRRAGFMSVTPRPVSALDAVELAVEESAPSTV